MKKVGCTAAPPGVPGSRVVGRRHEVAHLLLRLAGGRVGRLRRLAAAEQLLKEAAEPALLGRRRRRGQGDRERRDGGEAQRARDERAVESERHRRQLRP